MRVTREFKIGILVVLSLLFLFVGFNFLKSFKIFSSQREFSAEFEKSLGLEVSDPVLMNGVEVGNVTSVGLNPDDASGVLVYFTVDDGALDIPNNTALWLVSSDILGSKVLDLRLSTNDSTFENWYYEDGDRFDQKYVHTELSLEDQFEKQYMPIKEKAKELVTRVENIVLSVTAFWDTSAAYSVDASLYDVRNAGYRFDEMSDNISSMVTIGTKHVTAVKDDTKRLSTTFQGLTGKISRITENVDDLTKTFGDSDIGADLSKLKTTFAAFSDSLGQLKLGKGSIGLLVFTNQLKDGIAKTKEAFKELNTNLEASTSDYIGSSIFGIKAEGYQPTKEHKKELNALLDTLEKGKDIDYKKP